jgi:hypothetical protein
MLLPSCCLCWCSWLQIFPSASHNRFEHSLGVAHLASECTVSGVEGCRLFWLRQSQGWASLLAAVLWRGHVQYVKPSQHRCSC